MAVKPASASRMARSFSSSGHVPEEVPFVADDPGQSQPRRRGNASRQLECRFPGLDSGAIDAEVDVDGDGDRGACGRCRLGRERDLFRVVDRRDHFGDGLQLRQPQPPPDGRLFRGDEDAGDAAFGHRLGLGNLPDRDADRAEPHLPACDVGRAMALRMRAPGDPPRAQVPGDRSAIGLEGVQVQEQGRRLDRVDRSAEGNVDRVAGHVGHSLTGSPRRTELPGRIILGFRGGAICPH